MVNINNSKDKLSNEIFKIISTSNEPLETKEIEKAITEKIKTKKKTATRTKIFYRLMLLRGESLINGKFVGPGKGVWIWWRKSK